MDDSRRDSESRAGREACDGLGDVPDAAAENARAVRVMRDGGVVDVERVVGGVAKLLVLSRHCKDTDALSASRPVISKVCRFSSS